MTDTHQDAAGFTAAGYEPVRDAFAAAIAPDTDTGAALSVWREGRLVVDLAGGVADASTGRAWTLHTPGVVFSSTKGLMSILLARLVQEGRLDYDAPVTQYWPEYGVHRKELTRVSEAISHRAGLSAPRVDWGIDDLLDWHRATELLAAEEPLWLPGTAYAYHAITHGWLTGELVRRVTGRMPGEYFADLVAQPVNADTFIGLPAEHRLAVANMVVGDSLAAAVEQGEADLVAGASVWPARAMTLGGALPPALVGPGEGFNRADVQAAQIPGAGGISTAHGLAKIWSAVVTETDGVRLLDDATIARATVEQSAGAPFFDTPGPWPRWGMGFQLDSEARRYLGPSSLGHDGAGGQVAFGDVDARVGFAFITNRMESGDTRGTSILTALKGVLDIAD